MKRTGKCPKCGSTKVLADAKAIDRGHGNLERELSIATFGNRQAFFFTDKKTTTVSAWVCSDCGYIEFYADHPAKIIPPTY